MPFLFGIKHFAGIPFQSFMVIKLAIDKKNYLMQYCSKLKDNNIAIQRNNSKTAGTWIQGI